jgi:selenocysteine lyase/cysteine desulfurase
MTTAASSASTSSLEPDWAAIRQRHRPVDDRAYLDTACKGIPGPSALDSIAAHCAFLRDCPGTSTTADTLVALEQFERARRAAATLVNGSADEVALVPSTQAGLNAIADALDLRAGDVVLVSDLEFVGTVLPWRALAGRGVEVRYVPHRGGRVLVDDFESAIDKRTRAIVVSSVQEVNGYAVDLERFAGLCVERDLVSVVDGIQHVGPLRIDVAETPVDVLVVGGHKWLCAPFGMGFLYLRRRLHDALRPTMPGYMTTEPPEGEWLDYLERPDRLPSDRLRFPRDARMLELGAIGTSLAAAGLAGAVEELLEIGPDAVAKRTAELVQIAADALRTVGAAVLTPIDNDRQPGFLCFSTGLGIDADRAAVEQLAAAGVLTSLRFTTGIGGIRVSPYFYSDECDIERLQAVVARIRAHRAP